MTYLSVCSGIEAATVAWQPLGWEAAAYSEIEPNACAVLAHHYPNVPNLGDMTKYEEWNIERPIDVLVGGTPCQSFSVAGLRKGLADPRGDLMLTYGAIAGALQSTWIVWENVPGVLSSNEGRDFGTFLGMLAELGYGFAYRILDAQYVRVESHPRAVPQRRRRVFVVGYLGDWRPAAAVLFESESLYGYPPPRREAGKKAAGTLADSSNGGGANGPVRTADSVDTLQVAQGITSSYAAHRGRSAGKNGQAYNMIVAATLSSGGNNGGFRTEPGEHLVHEPAVSPAMKSRDAKGVSSDGDGLPVIAFAQNQRDEVREMSVAGAIASEPGMKQQTYVAHPLKAEGFDASEDGTSRGTPIVFTERSRSEGRTVETQEECAYALTNPGSGGRTHSRQLMDSRRSVRRLTPRECERLQGFPDDYTLVPNPRGKPMADGPRYRMLGNSMAVNVMRWIGDRIAKVTA